LVVRHRLVAQSDTDPSVFARCLLVPGRAQLITRALPDSVRFVSTFGPPHGCNVHRFQRPRWSVGANPHIDRALRLADWHNGGTVHPNQQQQNERGHQKPTIKPRFSYRVIISSPLHAVRGANLNRVSCTYPCRSPISSPIASRSVPVGLYLCTLPLARCRQSRRSHDIDCSVLLRGRQRFRIRRAVPIPECRATERTCSESNPRSRCDEIQRTDECFDIFPTFARHPTMNDALACIPEAVMRSRAISFCMTVVRLPMDWRT